MCEFVFSYIFFFGFTCFASLIASSFRLRKSWQNEERNFDRLLYEKILQIKYVYCMMGIFFIFGKYFVMVIYTGLWRLHAFSRHNYETIDLGHFLMWGYRYISFFICFLLHDFGVALMGFTLTDSFWSYLPLELKNEIRMKTKKLFHTKFEVVLPHVC